MTELFIDCEFSGENLISMAIVDLNGEFEFYEVLELSPSISIYPWVKENVLPILNKSPVPYLHFQQKLWEFLYSIPYMDLSINADWPQDLIHFLNSILLKDGYLGMLPIPKFQLKLDRRLSSKKAEIPHNALSDAYAIRDSYRDLKND